MQNPSPLRRPTPGSVGSPGFRVTEVSCYAAGGCDPPPERWSHPEIETPIETPILYVCMYTYIIYIYIYRPYTDHIQTIHISGMNSSWTDSISPMESPGILGIGYLLMSMCWCSFPNSHEEPESTKLPKPFWAQSHLLNGSNKWCSIGPKPKFAADIRPHIALCCWWRDESESKLVFACVCRIVSIFSIVSVTTESAGFLKCISKLHHHSIQCHFWNKFKHYTGPGGTLWSSLFQPRNFCKV